MYANMPNFNASLFGARQPNNLYRQVGVQTGVDSATPHALVLMLLDGALESINRARGAMRTNDIATKSQAISKAVAIVDEGLKSSLNMSIGELAANLASLYEYITWRLTQANLRNDEALLDECIALLTPIREGWAGIADQASKAPTRGGLELRA